MENRGQCAGKAPKIRLLAVVERAIGNEPCEQVRLSQRNETIPLYGRGRLTIRLIHKATANTIAISSETRAAQAP